MGSMLIAGGDRRELDEVKRQAREVAATLCDEDWSWSVCAGAETVRDFLQAQSPADIASIDLALEGGIPLAEALRSANSDALLMLVAAAELSPMSYLKPSIMAAGLLLRPYTAGQLREVLRQMFAAHAQKAAGPDEAFAVSSREGRFLVPYGQIYYFEAREKRIILNAGVEEYSFGGTLDGLEAELPEGFVRCHRSFIVRRARVRAVMLARSLIQLEGGAEIPLSRSYKAAFRGRGGQ